MKFEIRNILNVDFPKLGQAVEFAYLYREDSDGSGYPDFEIPTAMLGPDVKIGDKFELIPTTKIERLMRSIKELDDMVKGLKLDADIAMALIARS